MVTIEYSPAFEKMYGRLPADVQHAAEKKEVFFRCDPFDPRLKTHKLSGRLRGYWSFSISYQYRVIFNFVSDTHIRFHAVGTHAIYEKL